MYPRITITKESILQSEEWHFLLFDMDIVLDSYRLKNRESKRHKFQTEKSYNRIGSSSMASNEVPFSEELKVEAKQKCIDQLRVCLWEGRK